MDTTPMVSKEISDFGREARSGSAEQSYQNYSQGNQNASGLMKDSGSFDSGLSYQNPELTAIRGKYGAQANRDQQRLSLNTLRQGEEDHLRKIQIANQMASEEIAINQQKEALRHKRKQMARASRGAVVGNVLGVVGAVVGGIYGGPAGGAAGYAGGQAVGNAVGGA